MNRHLSLPIVFGTFLLLLLYACTGNKNDVYTSLEKELDASRILLPNGWSLTVPGTSVPLGDLPLNIVVSDDRALMAVTNNGQSEQSIMLIDPQSTEVLDKSVIPKSWYGLAFNDDHSRLYCSAGNDNLIRIYDTSARKLEEADSIVLGAPWPNMISPTGLALDRAETFLYVATKDDSALYRVNLLSRERERLFLGHEAYACVLSPDEQELYVSLWGGSAIAVVDSEALEVRAVIPVDSNPNDIVLSDDGMYLFTSCANENTVHIIDVGRRKVVEVLQTTCFPDAPAGSTPNALALSPDQSRMYVANADNNSLAVFDVSEVGESHSLGFIPTGWYPTAVKVFGDKVWVANGKGSTSYANPRGPDPYGGRAGNTQYIGGLFKGSLTVVDEPDDGALQVYTAAVYKNTPYSKDLEMKAKGEEGNPVPQVVGDPSPIKYVFYIIKENRTYDQVLGDVPEGNGDPDLCLFPELITPNQHKLAREFVLLDNFYVNAEVSADGHNWSMAAYANDFVEKTWPSRYSRRGGLNDTKGTRTVALPPDGFIWAFCQRAGITYRSYGEFVDDGKTPLESLEGHFDPDYPGYDLTISDMLRLEKWLGDFDSLEAAGAVPQFSTIRLPNDHTAGARVGMPTPKAMVAENDLALGRIIERISHSAIWRESAVFVLEDDAQNGPDHVDAHRSIAFVASPYARRNVKVSTMYTTTSMLRTMELILGLPPMSQYDAASTSMWECFSAAPDYAPFVALEATWDIHEMNTEESVISRLSDSFNLEEIDAAPDHAFSEVIWKAVRGLDSEMPAPVRAAFVLHQAEEEDL